MPLPDVPAVDVEGKAAAAEVEGSPEKSHKKNQISIQFIRDR